jgi:hypothetical protein
MPAWQVSWQRLNWLYHSLDADTLRTESSKSSPTISNLRASINQYLFVNLGRDLSKVDTRMLFLFRAVC